MEQIAIKNGSVPSFGEQKYFEGKYVLLEDNFAIGLGNYGYKDQNSVGGFGITLEKLGQKTFSWEWYNQVNGNEFDKLQEGGSLKVEFAKRDEYWEIKRIDFIGDQRLRCDNKEFFSDNKGWLLYIKDGSHIEF